MKIVFQPGALDAIPEEDREELLKAIQNAVEDGSFFTEAEPVDFDKMKEEEPELYEALMRNIESLPVEGEVEFEMEVKDPIDKLAEVKKAIIPNASKITH